MHTDSLKMSIRVNRQLFSAESEYQRIDVFESPQFGRFLTLDGDIIFSEQDEFIYNEMVVHVPMAVHPCSKKSAYYRRRGRRRGARADRLPGDRADSRGWNRMKFLFRPAASSFRTRLRALTTRV